MKYKLRCNINILFLETDYSSFSIAPPRGTAPNLSPNARPVFQKMIDASRTYGDMVGITLIGRKMVFVSSADKLRSLWQDAGEAVTGRFTIGMLEFLNPKQLGNS